MNHLPGFHCVTQGHIHHLAQRVKVTVQHMTVYAQRGGYVAVPQPGLNILCVTAALTEGIHHRMPLWHNKDKSDNPCDATG